MELNRFVSQCLLVFCAAVFFALSSYADIQTEKDLINSLTRPTVQDIKRVFPQWPQANPFGIPQWPKKRLEFDIPSVIARFELAFPGARWVIVGRDQVMLGDILSAFYESIGQNHRVIRLDVSNTSFAKPENQEYSSNGYQALERLGFSNLPKKYSVPLTMGDVEAFAFMTQNGLDLEQLKDPNTPPYIIVDISSWREDSQVRKLMRAGYRVWSAMGNPPVDLYSKFNIIATGFTFPIHFPPHDIESFRQLQKQSITASAAMTMQPVYIDTVAYNYTTLWHDLFKRFSWNDDGTVVYSHPGVISTLNSRRSILADMFEAITATRSESFLKQVELSAENLGYKFPKVQTLTLEFLPQKKMTKSSHGTARPTMAANPSDVNSTYRASGTRVEQSNRSLNDAFTEAFESRVDKSEQATLDKAKVLIEDMAGMLEKYSDLEDQARVFIHRLMVSPDLGYHEVKKIIHSLEKDLCVEGRYPKFRNFIINNYSYRVFRPYDLIHVNASARRFAKKHLELHNPSIRDLNRKIISGIRDQELDVESGIQLILLLLPQRNSYDQALQVMLEENVFAIPRMKQAWQAKLDSAAWAKDSTLDRLARKFMEETLGQSLKQEASKQVGVVAKEQVRNATMQQQNQVNRGAGESFVEATNQAKATAVRHSKKSSQDPFDLSNLSSRQIDFLTYLSAKYGAKLTRSYAEYEILNILYRLDSNSCEEKDINEIVLILSKSPSLSYSMIDLLAARFSDKKFASLWDSVLEELKLKRELRLARLVVAEMEAVRGAVPKNKSCSSQFNK